MRYPPKHHRTAQCDMLNYLMNYNPYIKNATADVSLVEESVKTVSEPEEANWPAACSQERRLVSSAAWCKSARRYSHAKDCRFKTSVSLLLETDFRKPGIIGQPLFGDAERLSLLDVGVPSHQMRLLYNAVMFLASIRVGYSSGYLREVSLCSRSFDLSVCCKGNTPPSAISGQLE